MGGVVDRMTAILVANRCCDRERGAKIVQAMLRAAFDPTEEMVEAGFQNTGDREDIVKAWQAMLLVALKEGVDA